MRRRFNRSTYRCVQLPYYPLKIFVLQSKITKYISKQLELELRLELENKSNYTITLEYWFVRGANLKDATLELMQTPLHMSQTIRQINHCLFPRCQNSSGTIEPCFAQLFASSSSYRIHQFRDTNHLVEVSYFFEAKRPLQITLSFRPSHVTAC